ncbi:Mitochondrial dicarboxylate carrier [Nymphon striatum]|nr:Mitochondrial dicarboxylate carrier [Nymphon striatum]KAG1658538.1 Mitochondrial dicarboxylate carrier [Nymphon striatum]
MLIVADHTATSSEVNDLLQYDLLHANNVRDIEDTYAKYITSFSFYRMVVKGENPRVARWYFGGVAGAMAVFCTHPLDLIKVHLQTQQEGKPNIMRMSAHIYKTQGIFAFYNGMSASLLRQLSYTTARFGLYETAKQIISVPGEPLPFYKKAFIAACGGAAGGVVGTPADMVNVRMQNDIKLPPELRRNYKHAIDGIYQVFKHEGVKGLFTGVHMATGRAIMMTIGQLSFYDQIKQSLLQSEYFTDSLSTHFISSICAGAVATTLTQPMDVLKTRTMNAKPGEFRSLWHCIVVTAKLGPLGFYKGYVPAFIRLAPQTVLTFMFLEQLRQNFGYEVKS